MLYAKINLLKYTDIIPMLKKRWDDAVEFQDTLRKVAKQKEGDKKKDPISPAGNAANATSNRSVVLWLDEVGLAEHSPHRPLKVLHKLLEDGNPTIAFIGLSNWKLDAAKMNRMVLHQVTQPDDQELVHTAQAILNEKSEGENDTLQQQLNAKIQNITRFYDSVMTDQNNSPFQFDFYSYRDFYSLIGYLKFICQTRGRLSNALLVESIMRNFGGMTKEQTEAYLFPKIAQCFYNGALPVSEFIWKDVSPLQLIRLNIEQTQHPKTPSMRNIMLITESPVMWKILFDSGIAMTESTEVIFGSKFPGDIHSTIHLYRTIEKVRNAMATGKTCILLKLEQLYDSLYDVLNQRYQTVDGQKLSCLFILVLFY
ncbi:ring finger protein [Reticulomyxa filosa]|uniref:Ring finger protein n=1 Tax=Reticulomyxa filosa TaxID=46433 RepID=X6NZA7_RETFI|nr:ring finger protein [Reticulomyxa filosa]|eukprot:ETO31218.1 ring finger protein [Reticulomyxa filosa]